MNESQLYKYALIAVLGGFLILGYVVLFVPLTFSDDSSKYVDGEIIQVFPSKNGGQVIKISETVEKSLFLDSQESLEVGVRYRFYDPVTSIDKNALIPISAYRKLS